MSLIELFSIVNSFLLVMFDVIIDYESFKSKLSVKSRVYVYVKFCLYTVQDLQIPIIILFVISSMNNLLLF